MSGKAVVSMKVPQEVKDQITKEAKESSHGAVSPYLYEMYCIGKEKFNPSAEVHNIKLENNDLKSRIKFLMESNDELKKGVSLQESKIKLLQDLLNSKDEEIELLKNRNFWQRLFNIK